MSSCIERIVLQHLRYEMEVGAVSWKKPLKLLPVALILKTDTL